ncbi:MAG: MBL fold metallo-hydrolase, partial [Chloroflexi bacterium]|nr:MBL fold metallo-hydrolase [Chloroflexota bacterium]
MPPNKMTNASVGKKWTTDEVLVELQKIDDRLAQVASLAWGPWSRPVAQGFLQRSGAALEDARRMTAITEVAPRTWHIVMPFANMSVFETNEGIVLVDAGGACHGPALLEAIRSVSGAPIHTAIYTHAHIDHAYGLWAFEQAGEMPKSIIAHEKTVEWFKHYIRMRGFEAYHQGQQKDWPDSKDDIFWPTQTYRDTLELVIGGEKFILNHDRGETDDATWVWVPGRRVLASGDFYLHILPNVGNPRRTQRHPEDWAIAVEKMVALKPEFLLPGHGGVVYGEKEIRTALLDVAEVLHYIVDYTLSALNARQLREDQIYANLKLSEKFLNNPKLQPFHVTAQDICRMVINQYTGWWNDRPADIDPAPVEAQAKEIARLAGGVDVLSARARELAETDLKLAAQLAEWAFYADPSNPQAQNAMIDVFLKRA